MNKNTIITILLALVAVAGQAQVKSSLDLCLRDEATGEWLIGLFDDYAIYDCKYWNNAEVGKDHVVLTKDGLRKEVRLKKNAAIIDGRKHKTSVLTAQFLPDYPSMGKALTQRHKESAGPHTFSMNLDTDFSLFYLFNDLYVDFRPRSYKIP